MFLPVLTMGLHSAFRYTTHFVTEGAKRLGSSEVCSPYLVAITCDTIAKLLCLRVTHTFKLFCITDKAN